MYSYRNVNKKLRPRQGQSRSQSKGLKRLLAFGTPLFAFTLASASIVLLVNDAISASPTQTAGARIFSEGLNIKLDRTSPAYAALEDAWSEDLLDDAITENPIQVSSTQELVAGRSSEEVADRILKESRRESALAAHEKASREAQGEALAMAAARVFSNMAARLEKTSIVVPAAAPEPAPVTPPSEKVVFKMAKKSLPPIEHPVQTLSLSDLKMSREEVVSSLLMPLVQAGSTKPSLPAVNPIVFARHNQDPIVMGADPRKRFDRDRQQRDPARAELPEAVKAFAATDAMEIPKESSPDASVYRQVFISGPLEFHGGLAMANAQDRVVIYRERDGEVLEAGAVWLREGRYEIFVEETDGVLLAELRTTYGDILGRGVFDLADLPAQPENTRRIDPIHLKIKPVPQGVVGNVLARRSGTLAMKPQALAGASVVFKDLSFSHETKLSGRFEEPNLLEGSSVVVKATRMGYWGTMAFATAGQESRMDIFPDQSGQVIQELIAMSRSTSRKNQPAAIIWGQVSRNGQPVAGATVDLMTSDEGVRPIYFNSAMLPDLNLKVTSSNGLYAFYPIAPGAHAVQAHIANVTTEASVFPAEDRTVSRADLEITVDRPAKIRVFDAFRTDWPLAASVSDPSHTRQIQIDRTGESKYKYSSGNGPLILDVDAGRNYNLMRVTADRGRRAIYVPMVQSAWIDGIRNGMKFNSAPHTGTIVGFVQGPQAYRVVLNTKQAEKPVENSARVIYFNARGEPTGKQFGEPGGGFMILNADEGFQTVTIQPSGTTKIYSSVVLVESTVTNVISHWIR